MLACDFSTSSRDPNRVNFPHSRAGTLPLATAASRLTLGTCILYLRQDKQPAHRSARWQCYPPLASCVSLSYLKLDGKRSTLPAYLGPIPYGQDHTRTIDGRRPGHRDGDALVQLLQPGAMVGKSVITHSLFPTFIPSCPALPDLPPHPSTTLHFPPQPLHASSHAASHHRRPVRITLHICKRGLSCPTGHLTTPSATTPRFFCTFPRLRVPPTRTHLVSHATP